MSTQPTKNVQTELLAWQDIATANVARTPNPYCFDCSQIWSAIVGIKVGRQSASAFT